MLFRTDYWHDERAREAFKRFLATIFGLDLSAWDALGYWDHEHYRAFSLFDGDEVIANVCLYTMDMVVGGERRRLGQISGVGTLPAYRRRGLCSRLTAKALEWAERDHEGYFLFSTDEALPLYSKLGFVPVEESVAIARVAGSGPRGGFRKLVMNDSADRALLYRLARERCPVSDVLGVLNDKLLMFHCLHSLRDRAYYIADHDVAVLFAHEGYRLTLFDVVGRRVPTFEQLHCYLAGFAHDEVRFRFVPDKMGVDVARTVRLEGSNAHLLPPFVLPRPICVFPYVAVA